MKFDFNTPLLDLDEKPIKENGKPTMLGELLARALVNNATGNPVKCFDWAMAAHHGKPLELDRSDIDTLKKLVEDSLFITNLAKAPILGILNKVK